MKKKHAELVGVIKKYQKRYGVSNESVATAMCMAKSTFIRKLRYPEKLTISELTAAIVKLKIPHAEILPLLLEVS